MGRELVELVYTSSAWCQGLPPACQSPVLEPELEEQQQPGEGVESLGGQDQCHSPPVLLDVANSLLGSLSLRTVKGVTCDTRALH